MHYNSSLGPVQVWLVLPIVFSVTQIFLLVLPIIQAPLEVGLAIVLIASGLPVYYIAIYNEYISKKISIPLRKCSKL